MTFLIWFQNLKWKEEISAFPMHFKWASKEVFSYHVPACMFDIDKDKSPDSYILFKNPIYCLVTNISSNKQTEDNLFLKKKAWLVLEAVQSAWTVEDVAAVYDEFLHRTSIYKWKLQFYYKFHYKCTWLWDRGDSSKGKIRPKFGFGSTRGFFFWPNPRFLLKFIKI